MPPSGARADISEVVTQGRWERRREQGTMQTQQGQIIKCGIITCPLYQYSSTAPVITIPLPQHTKRQNRTQHPRKETKLMREKAWAGRHITHRNKKKEDRTQQSVAVVQFQRRVVGPTIEHMHAAACRSMANLDTHGGGGGGRKRLFHVGERALLYHKK